MADAVGGGRAGGCHPPGSHLPCRGRVWVPAPSQRGGGSQHGGVCGRLEDAADGLERAEPTARAGERRR